MIVASEKLHAPTITNEQRIRFTDYNKPSTAVTDSVGLGFRATIPKLPSFRVSKLKILKLFLLLY